jgi:predicted molibdopterin-dependent oxidoreductase YjgC
MSRCTNEETFLVPTSIPYDHPSQIMDEIARLTPTFTGVSYAKLDELGSVQWPCNEKTPEGTPAMHIGGLRGKGKFIITEYVATDERAALPAPAHHRPHPQSTRR